MKVAIVHERVDARRGGAETSILEMAEQLAKLNAAVTIVTSGAEESSTAEAAGVKVQSLPIAGSRLGRAIGFIGAADRYTREHGFDIVHAVTPCFSANVYQPRGGTYAETVNRSVARGRSAIGRMIKRLGRRMNRRQRFLLLAERQMLTASKPPLVAAGSEYVRGHVMRDFAHLPPDHVRVIFNGVGVGRLTAGVDQREQERTAIGVNTDQRLILFVAHNFKLKGLGELLRACALLPESLDWKLAVAGRDDPTAFRRIASGLGIAGRVAFVGADRDIPALYAAADLLAHPTWYDPCSRVVLEALCAGLPAVTTRYNGAAEVIEPGSNGGVVKEPSDSRALAAEIECSLDPSLREKCRAGAPAMRERLSMERHARELMELYETVAAR